MANSTPLSQEELKKLIDLYQTINKLNKIDAENAAKKAQSNKTAREELEKMQDIMDDYVNNIGYAEAQFQKMVDNIRGYSSGVNKAASQFDKLKGIAAKISDIQNGTTKSSLKELQSLKEKLESERNRFKAIKINLEDQLKNTSLNAKEQFKIQQSLDKVNNFLNSNNAEYKAMLGAITQEEKILNNIGGALGVTGALMKGMSKIPFLGNLPGMSKALEDVEEDIRAIEKEEGRVVGKSEAMKMAFKKMGPSIKEGLTDPLVVGGFLLNQLKDALVLSDKATGDLAKSMNMTYDAASKTRTDLNGIANRTFDASVNTQRLQESMVAVGNALGTNAQLNEKDLVTMTKLREKAGLTNEELIGMEKITLATGGNLEDNTKVFLGGAKALSMQNGLAINVKQLMKETSNVSNAIKLSITGGAKGLAEAAVQAKTLGVNLDQVDKIAGSLLNFEDNISAELEAELLTGKQINLERARLAALNGDLATVAKEINEQIGGSAEFSKMNRIQQEAFAKSVGMSREELANSLVEQEALASVGRDLSKEEQEAYEAAKKQYGEKEAAKRLAEGQLDDMMHQQSIQDRLNDSILKMKDILVTIAQPILQIVSPLVDLLQNVLMPINAILGYIQELFGKMGDSISKAIGPLSTFGKIIKGVAGMAIILAAYKTYAAVSTALMATIYGGLTAPIVGGLAAAAITTAGFGLLNNIKDGMIGPDGGLIVSGEKGTYQLDKDDTVIAGTSLGKNNGGNGGGNVGIDYDLLASKIASAIANMPAPNVVVKMDGRQVAESVNQTNLQTQVKTQ